MIKTIFFDFDGVLTLDARGSATVCKNIQALIPDVPYEKVLSCYRVHHQQILCGEMKKVDTWDEFCTCIGKQLDFSVLHDAYANIPVNDSMFALAHALSKNYTLGIITDNGIERFDLITTLLKLNDLFHYIIVSARVGSTKSHPEIFRKALESAGCAADECVFIDNDQKNLIIAAELGFHTFWHNHEKNDVRPLIKQLELWGVILSS